MFSCNADNVLTAKRQMRLRHRFPTLENLRKAARGRVPAIGYDMVAGGLGQDLAVQRNAAALDAIKIVPRFGIDAGPIDVSVELFGRRYNAPIGVAPMGLQGLFWPGAERHLARAAQQSRIPYTISTVHGFSIEDAVAMAPDVAWFQLYRFAKDDHKVSMDLVRRAERAGAHVLVITVDTPERAKRPSELRHRLAVPFRPTMKTILEVAVSPQWLAALWQHGRPGFPCLAPYCGNGASALEIARFSEQEIGGAFTWEELKRFRDVWKGPLVIKGVMHPADAEAAKSIGFDGVQVSNHGGRQFEAAPAPVDVLPAIAAAVGTGMTILCDGGVRSGTDVARMLALGAHATFAGRAFLYGVGAIGASGAQYVTDLLAEELQAAMRQMGAVDFLSLRSFAKRHADAVIF